MHHPWNQWQCRSQVKGGLMAPFQSPVWLEHSVLGMSLRVGRGGQQVDCLWGEVGKGCILHRVSKCQEPTLAGPGRWRWGGECGRLEASQHLHCMEGVPLDSKSNLCWFEKAPIKYEYKRLETSASNSDWKCAQGTLFIQSHSTHLQSPSSALVLWWLWAASLGCALWFTQEGFCTRFNTYLSLS